MGHAPMAAGVGKESGAGLIDALDWRGHRVFDHGWEHGRGWVERSRPYVHVNNVYGNDGRRNAIINPSVTQRRVNYQALDRYDDVHRGSNFDNFHRSTGGVAVADRAAPPHRGACL